MHQSSLNIKKPISLFLLIIIPAMGAWMILQWHIVPYLLFLLGLLLISTISLILYITKMQMPQRAFPSIYTAFCLCFTALIFIYGILFYHDSKLSENVDSSSVFHLRTIAGINYAQLIFSEILMWRVSPHKRHATFALSSWILFLSFWVSIFAVIAVTGTYP